MIAQKNPGKILSHWELLEQVAKDRTFIPPPVTVEFDLTNVCNQKCPWCRYAESRNGEVMTEELALRLLGELAELNPMGIVFPGGGEPLTHPAFSQIIRKARSYGHQVGIVSNGLLVTGERAEAIGETARFLRISVDAGNPETYIKMHGTVPGAFERVLSNLKAFSETYGKDCMLSATYVLSDGNADEIRECANRLAEVGVRYLHVRPDCGLQVDDPVLAEKAQAATVDTAIPVVVSFDRFPGHYDPSPCCTSQLVAVIGADANLYVCYNYKGTLSFGNVEHRPFALVWFSDEHRRVLASIDATKCIPCRFQQYNTLVAETVADDRMHHLFL